MTTNELVEYYAKLLILQYREKPKAFNTIKTLVRPVIMDQLPVAVQNAFDISTAVGVQLDTLGKYVGVVRSGSGFTGPITLDDDDFRQLILVAIVRNNFGSSLYDIQQYLKDWFDGLIYVFDYQNMRMSYFLSTGIGSYDLAQMIVMQQLLPKPMGVQLAITIFAPVIDGFFGMRTYQHESVLASPMNDYLDYQMDWPWLDYNDGLLNNGSLLTQEGDVIVQEDGDLLFY